MKVINQRITVEELSQQVSLLKTQIEKETTGFTGWIKWLSLILAFVAALFAVPKGAFDVWDYVHSRPHTTVTPESSLALTYNPLSKSIAFQLGFTITNDGNRKDTIQSLTGNLKRIDVESSADVLSFGENDFRFTEKSGKIPNHFPITESTPREVDCFLSAYLDEETRDRFLTPKSRWQLVIELTGEYKKKNSLKYCFDVSQDDIDDLFGAQEMKTTQINNPNCEGYQH